MHIVIAGGSGFLGSSLSERFAEEGHDVRVLSRSLPAGVSRHDAGTGMPGVTRMGWEPDGRVGPWVQALAGANAVINLAGASIVGTRWTPQRKAEIRDSRLYATRSLVAAIDEARPAPRLFISSSGTDYYGARGAEPLTEASPAGTDFLATLCQDWEAEARKVSARDVRLAIVRTGVVLDRGGGAFARMLTPFRWGAGGPLGSGMQYMPWIHRLDWIEIVRWIVQTPEASGAINLTAPHPVTSRAFARALGRAMRRPAVLRAPRVALQIVFGEFADYIVTGQRVIPERVLTLGYHFRYPELDMALSDILAA